jgi:hypothetical protein
MATRQPDPNLGARRQTFAAALLIALLLLGGWWLMSEIQGHRDVENCLASGRRDCVPIVPDK